MRPRRLTALVLATLLVAGCGDVLKELDDANALASQPSGNRPVPPAAPGATPAVPGAKPAAAPTEEPGLLAKLEAWLGIGGEPKGTRRPPDPNDPLVVCRLGGSTSFMLKSGCVSRQGVVIASKGPAH